MSARAQWVASGEPLCSATGLQIAPAIAPDGSGGAIVAWQDYRTGTSDIYVQRVDASGALQWTSAAVAVCTAANFQYTPKIVADGSGGAIITWFDIRNGNYDVYAQRVDAAGAVRWTVDGLPVCTATNQQINPAIVSDGSGGAIIAWQDSRNDADDIYAQRIDASGAVQWVADGVQLCGAGGSQQDPMIVPDGSHGAIVTWADSRSGNFDIYARRIDASGAVQWTADGVALCTAQRTQAFPTIVADGTGGAIVAWYDGRTHVDNDIYVRRVDASGTAQWASNGVALCTASGDQLYPTIATDGAGGAIITWYDQRSGDFDIYAQRVDATGAVQWNPGGVALCSAANDQDHPVVVSDGSGGAIIAWQDSRDDADDVYAQRVNASGASQWSPGGVAVCAHTFSQVSPVLVPRADGGAIVAWEDQRSGSDIYALRVGAGGATASVAGPPAGVGMSLSQGYPSPFSVATSLDLDLAADAKVDVEAYDDMGRRVRHSGVFRASAGRHHLVFDGRDDMGRPLASGVYFYRVRAAGRTLTRKLLIER